MWEKIRRLEVEKEKSVAAKKSSCSQDFGSQDDTIKMKEEPDSAASESDADDETGEDFDDFRCKTKAR